MEYFDNLDGIGRGVFSYIQYSIEYLYSFSLLCLICVEKYQDIRPSNIVGSWHYII